MEGDQRSLAESVGWALPTVMAIRVGHAWWALPTLLLSASLASAVVANEWPKVAFSRQPGGVVITVGGEPLATYVYDDPEITRPYFAHVHAPGGIQVTRNHPPVAGVDKMDHPTFHPGIWMSFGDVSGRDYWRLKCRVMHDAFLNLPQGGPGRGTFAVRNRYLPGGHENLDICREDCTFTIRVRPEGFLLTWDSTFQPARESVYFGDQEEMGLGIRVATPLRVEQGDGSIPPGNGTILDAKGRRNGAEVGGNSADWCDYSGTLDGGHPPRRVGVGITIFCHPGNFRPSWFHARDYGFVAANPFGRAAFRKGELSKVVVKYGESLRLRYGILLHSDSDGRTVDVDAAYTDYVRVSAE